LHNYSALAEASEKAFHQRYRSERVTHYIHCLFYHHLELQQECSYQQEQMEQAEKKERNSDPLLYAEWWRQM